MCPDQLRLRSDELARLVARWPSARGDRGLERSVDGTILDALAKVDAGTAYAFEEQYGGQIVQNLKPERGHEREVSSRGRVPLRLHTDDAFLDDSARVQHFALVAIANPDHVPTVVVDVDDIVNAVDAATIEALSGSFFQFGRPASFGRTSGDTDLGAPRPVLRQREDGRIEVALSTEVWLAPGTDPAISDHIRSFRSTADVVRREEIHLGPGEILLISNSRRLHGRPAVTTHRWMKRVYLRRHIETLDAVAKTDRPRVYAASKVLDHARLCPPAW